MAWMSDEEFIYRQDIKEKKMTGRGAFHKKGGSKSKKCNFPSDYMTRKEKQALNGEVMSYNPNKFYSYAEFKQLPMEYQVKYVNSLMDKYQIGLSNVSTTLFGLSKSGLYAWFSKHKQLEYLNTCKPSQGMSKMFAKNAVKFKADIEASTNAEEIQNESAEEEPKELTLREKIDQAAETVKLYESRGMEMTPELINQIYEEKTGMNFAMAMTYMHTDEGLNVLSDNSEKSERLEDCKDVESFSITMHELDQDVINYIRDLFGAKDILVKIEVHQIK